LKAAEKQDAVGHGRLHLGAATWRTRRNIRIVVDSGPFAPFCENMMSSRKPEVDSTSHCCQRKT